MKQRTVIITYETLLDILRDYAGDENDIPPDAQATRLMIRPQEFGKLALEVVSSRWDGPQPPLELRFDLRRVYSVSGQGGGDGQ